MRKLGLDDVFSFSEILDTMDIDMDLNAIMDQAKAADDPQSFLGGKMMMLFIKNLHKAKKPIYEWIVSLTESTMEDVKAMGFVELGEVFKNIFESEDITLFLKSLASSEKN